MTSKFYLILLSCFILKQGLVAQVVPPPATQTEVNAGLNKFKYLTPFTFANSTLAGGPTNGVTATVSTNIVRSFHTNASPQAFFFENDRLMSKWAHPSMNGLEFWDDFDREGTNSPGIAPSGHPWKFDSTIGRNSNVVFTTGGYYKIATNATYGAAYWYVENTNGNSKWNRFGGSFRYLQHSSANGFQDLLGFLVATNSSLAGNWLHVGVNLQGFYIQQRTTNYLVNETYPTILQNDTEHNFEIIIEKDTIFARVGGYQYTYRTDEITNYNNGTMVFYEHNRSMTNLVAQYRGEWGSAYAGQSAPSFQIFETGLKVDTNGTLGRLNFTDGTAQTTSGSNSVKVAAGTGGITVTPSGSGGIMTYTISDDDAGGGGGGGGTNFPAVVLLVGGTNLPLVAGIEAAFHNQTNAAHTINLNLAVPPSGQIVSYAISNSSGSDFEVTINTNSVPANPYYLGTKTNVNTFTASASAITKAWLRYTAAGRWELERIEGPTAIQKFGPGIITDTNGVNGLDITVSTKRLTNYAHATTITINGATDVDMTVTNDLSAGATYTIATPTIGSSGVVRFRPDGSARTVAFQTWPAAIVPLSTNRFSNVTNIDLAASKWAYWNYDIARGTNGTTNCFVWVIQAP